ncbi:2-dehydro-3-deoxygluconokinase, putative [Rhodobacterales bacterium HTCC2150]|mgnify:FL=1|nr:2-dehydro-3-deoxygluconokinase, putative [Rhodobacterales bacterium HTCC2150] [Rhodobacteraceae bacterium HTCC2150]
MKVACIGEAMIELSIDATDHSKLGVAGDTLNTAIYMKRTAPELQIDYVTRLGGDSFSDRIRDFIASQGLGIDQIEMDADRIPGLYAINTDDAGERSFTYWRENAAARGLFDRKGDVDFSALSSYDAIYLSGISLAIMPVHVRQGLFAFLADYQGQFAFDSNYRPRLWEDKETAKAVIGAAWEIADISMPSIDDEMALFGDDTEADVQKRFEGYAPKHLALKRGPSGPFVPNVTGVIYPEAAKVVDTTAAGDSFNGAYLARLLSGADDATSAMAGHMCAANVVGHRGAIAPL